MKTVRRRQYFLGWCLAVLMVNNALAQQVAVSLPEKITSGVSKVEILGRTSQGILIRHTTRSDDEIKCFYDNMQLRWKKNLPDKERNSHLEKIIAYDDSLVFFYTITSKGITILKAYKTSLRIESSAIVTTCDTLSTTVLNPVPHPYFTTTPDKQLILCYYTDHNFEDNHVMYLRCFTSSLRKVWSRDISIKGLERPDLIDVVIDTAANACIATGDFKPRTFSNNFPYTALMITSVKNKGTQIHHEKVESNEVLFTSCRMKLDAVTNNVLMCGLFAHNPGTESEGICFLVYSIQQDSMLLQHYEGYTQEFLAQLTGNSPPKKNDGFYDFQPEELIVTHDGGAIFVAESQSITSEIYSNQPFGGFGLSTGFTVNYYHYDDLVVYAFNPDGSLKWKQILHKKQSTEGDGGFYSSAAVNIAPTLLYFVYNDVSNGQTTVSSYAVAPDGTQKRIEIFNADRKGVNVAPKQAQQISPDEMVIPSFKRNFLQFVKITFAP